MYPIKIQELRDLTDGVISGQVNLSAIVDGCVIDSRASRTGDAFFALKGARQHGVHFAADALTNGANVVLVDEALSGTCSVPHIAVPDAEIALAQLANHNRHRSDALVIAITGSVGKTTARRLITSVLETTHTGIQSPRNFNNHLGVPLSLLEIQDGDEFAVIEIGASAPREIEALAAIVEPEMAVITRVAPAHLKGFQSLQTVQRTKQELAEALSSDGTLFLNIDDPLVAEMAKATRANVITFGTNPEADVCATEVEAINDQLRLVVNEREYLVPICGQHNVTNVLAAIAVGLEVGVDTDQIAVGLRGYRAEAGRSFVTSVGDWTVVDDTYNSSPASVTAAIRIAEQYAGCHHRVMVLNDMLDLGTQAADLHYGIGMALATSKIDHVCVLGQFSDDVVEGFLSANGSLNRISAFEQPETLEAMLDCLLTDTDLIVVKGSRATHMEDVLPMLQRLADGGEEVIRRAA